MSNITHQISIFDMIEKPEKLDAVSEAIAHGSGYEGGRVRIFAAALNLSEKELAVFLKNEYGVGGCSMPFGFMDYDSNGIKLRFYNRGSRGLVKAPQEDRKIAWAEAARVVRSLIASNRYLFPAEQKQADAIKAKYEGVMPLPYPRYGFA